MKSKTVKTGISLPSYPAVHALIEGEAGRMFLQLEHKSFTEVGYLFGLDRFLTKSPSIRSAVARAYNLVLDNPETYGVPREKAAYIQGIVTSRSLRPKKETTVREQEEEKDTPVNIMLALRDTSQVILRKKLEQINKSPTQIKELKLRDIVWSAAVLFDKGQIAQGQATEHISILSKNISDDLTAEERMALVLKMREKQNILKEEKGKI